MVRELTAKEWVKDYAAYHMIDIRRDLRDYGRIDPDINEFRDGRKEIIPPDACWSIRCGAGWASCVSTVGYRISSGDQSIAFRYLGPACVEWKDIASLINEDAASGILHDMIGEDDPAPERVVGERIRQLIADF